LIAEVDAAYNDYEPTKATRAIAEFVQEIMSNWYVRLSRRRFWKGEYQQDKIAAYQTLFECLLSISKLMAPVAPFYADQLYRDLCNATQVEAFDSVHLAQFPVAITENRNAALEDRMSKARTIASLALSLRKKEQIKVRQPLQKIMVPVRNAAEREAIELVADLIQSEINVKSIELLDDASDILVKEIKPNFKALGTLAVQINGEEAEIEPNDVLIQSKDIEGWLVANGNGLTVALDIQLDDDLINEGIAREMINRIQNLRKDAGFEVTDKIILYLKEDVALVKVFEKHQAYIQQETLAKEIVLKKNLVDGENVEFDQIKTIINLEKV